MTVIILQIMRYGLYSSVDTSLQNAADNADDYVARTMERSDTLQSDDSSTDAFSGGTGSSGKAKPSTGGVGLSNVSVLLYDEDGKILNALDAFVQFGTLSTTFDEDSVGEIKEQKITTIFGQTEKYHVLAVKVSSSEYPSIKYATFLVSVRQLDEANERYVTITITVMVIFWIISVVASVYLANWTRKPIMESYEKQKSFVENASHELRTPLTLIYAPLNRMLKSLSTEDTQYLPIKAIYRQAQRMKNLINMVLDVRKMEVGESKLQIQPYVLNQWIEHVSQDFISEGEAKNVHIRYQLDPHIDTVSFDKDKCEIILSNLLINALKHSPLDTEITIMSELLSKRNSVRISIIDRGNGLKQVNTQKLFTRFYQGTGEQSGTGIGLSYSRILVELHGGSIGARDNQEAGATFFFELPLRQQSEEIVCQPKAYLNELMNDDSKEQLPEKNTFDTSPYSILVVDDNPDLTDFLKKSLGEYFKRVVIASDGVEALQLTRNHAPDIIVSDVMMPRMNVNFAKI